MFPNQINTSSLSADVRDAIDNFVNSHERGDLALRRWWEFESFCAVWWMLRAADDTPEVFPKGKSATLQVMEQMIEASIKEINAL
jgi:hypothetical protein